jgi:hypothetical protein
MADGHRVIPEHFREYRTAASAGISALDANPAEIKLKPEFYFFSSMKKEEQTNSKKVKQNKHEL